ncbi:MAG: LptE family protein [Planctomycetota bacterium]|nr:LptE family protein [Planctomycetota bacterium]
MTSRIASPKFMIRCLGIAVMVLGLPSGCARYQFGHQSLYDTSIRTIYIPVVRNDTFRQRLGVQLTEALQKAVELRTPYKVVANPSADSTLTCRVTSQSKRVVAETSTDEPRAVEALLTVELSWTDRQGNLLMQNRPVPEGEFAFYFVQGVDFVPEGGQSMATAQQRVVERLADQIVSQMESRW